MTYNDFGNPRTAVKSYTIDEKIGRSDSKDTTVFTVMTVISGTASLLPPSPLGRRNFIRIKNLDNTNSVYLLANADDEYTTKGYEVAHGEEWETASDTPLYIISTVAGTTNVQVYEKSSRFNYKE